MAIDCCVSASPDGFRTVVTLRYQQGLANTVVELCLGSSERTAKRWIALAHQRLANSL